VTIDPDSPVPDDAVRASPGPRKRRLTLRILLATVITYLFVAYLILPELWKRRELRHPALADAATLTHTADRIPGDPLNVALVGSEEQIHRSMLAAGWYPADPTTIRSALRIAADCVFKRPFDEAPVSALYLFGRKEDLAFEKPVGDNPRERHHVRFWRAGGLDSKGRPLWLGAATFDVHVGFSHDTGQVTHHIAPDVDRDRDLLIGDLAKVGTLSKVYWVDHFQRVLEGRNGEGDPWRSDGRLAVGVITESTPAAAQNAPADG
jgi:hypothetical protein